MLVYYFVPFIVSNRYLLFWVSNGHNSVTVQNRTHVYVNFFDHKDLGNRLLQLCPKVVKHPVYYKMIHGPYSVKCQTLLFIVGVKYWSLFCLMFFPSWLIIPSAHRSLLRGSSITHRYTTLGRTTLDEWSARSRDLYQTTHNAHNWETSCSCRDLTPQSQQRSGRKPTP